jgi:hypothetical protein
MILWLGGRPGQGIALKLQPFHGVRARLAQQVLSQ